MITKCKLNEDQRISFGLMVSEGMSEDEALILIQEYCIDRGYTGLKVQAFKFTPEGQRLARELEILTRVN